MEILDPTAVGLSEWSQIGSLLTNLWIVVVFVVLFASNVILGHNLIPSLVASRHVSHHWQKMRPGFYLAAVVAFAIAVFFFLRVVDTAADVIPAIFDGFWI